MSGRSALLSLLLLLPGSAAVGQEAVPPPAVSLEVSDERPLIGQTVELTALAGGTPLAGARVRVTYRPNSSTTSTDELAATDAAGTASWVPTAAGPVNLQVWLPGADGAPAVTHAVAVRYGRFPLSGLAIMLLAGALLFGGATYGMTKLLRSGAALPQGEPPST